MSAIRAWIGRLNMSNSSIALLPIGKSHGEKVLLIPLVIRVHDRVAAALKHRPCIDEQPKRLQLPGELPQGLAIVVKADAVRQVEARMQVQHRLAYSVQELRPASRKCQP